MWHFQPHKCGGRTPHPLEGATVLRLHHRQRNKPLRDGGSVRTQQEQLRVRRQARPVRNARNQHDLQLLVASSPRTQPVRPAPPGRHAHNQRELHVVIDVLTNPTQCLGRPGAGPNRQELRGLSTLRVWILWMRLMSAIRCGVAFWKST